MPRSITHEGGLRGVAGEIDTFFAGIEALQQKLAVILVQLPPSFEFNARLVSAFFGSLPRLSGSRVVCEPRHATWFTAAAEERLQRLTVSRVAADPARCAGAERPGGDPTFHYFRWHGSPTLYYSSYSPEQLDRFDAFVDARTPAWCIFDNTARHAAWDNALQFIAGPSSPPRS